MPQKCIETSLRRDGCDRTRPVRWLASVEAKPSKGGPEFLGPACASWYRVPGLPAYPPLSFSAAKWCYPHSQGEAGRAPRPYSRGMHDFRQLKVWQLSRELAVATDAITRKFPRADRGVVGGQLRRAALSVPANIAEGCGKSSRKDTVRFLQIALGSAKETENHVLIASDLHYLPPKAEEELLSRIHSIQRMLIGLMRNLPDEALPSWS